MEKNQIIVTGASGSIGLAAVRAMAQRGCAVIMACRNVEKGEKGKESVLQDFPDADLQVEQVDLDSLHSIRDFVNRLKDNNVRIGGLFNNAGTMCRSFDLTVDGFERTLAVNYLAPYYLTRALSPLFDAETRVVNMVSVTCKTAHVERDFFQKTERDFHQLRTYGDTKLALLLFTVALSQRLDCYVNMADPGVVNSNMIHLNRWFDPLADVLFRPFCKSPEKGAIPAVNALTTRDTLRYFMGKKSKVLEKSCLNHPNIGWLWQETESLLRQKGFEL